MSVQVEKQKNTQNITLVSKSHIGKCVLRTAKKYRLDPYLIWAVKRVETGRSLEGNRVGNNTNKTRDIGLMQTNSMHLKALKEFGITESHLKEPCISLDVAGWMLAGLIKKHGVREGVGRYHSGTPKFKNPYIKKVFKEWYSLVKTAKKFQ